MTEPEKQAVFYTLGLPESPWPNYPAQFDLTAADIPWLIAMAVDEHTRQEEGEDPTDYRNMHAWRSLGQLHAVEAIPALLGILRWVDDYNDEWTDEELPEVFAMLGADVIAPLSDYLANPENLLWARVAAVTSLEHIAREHPETAEDCARALARTLEQYASNDLDLNGFIVEALSKIRRPETYALVEQAFQADRVEQNIDGDWEDFQVRVGLLEKRLTPEPKFDWPRPNMRRGMWDPGAPPVEPEAQEVVKQAKKKEKNKQKQAKQSRKKNRKK